MSLIPKYRFDKYAEDYNGNDMPSSSNAENQFAGDDFAQFTDRMYSFRRLQRFGCPVLQIVLVRIKYINARLWHIGRTKDWRIYRLRSNIDYTNEIPVPAIGLQTRRGRNRLCLRQQYSELPLATLSMSELHHDTKGSVRCMLDLQERFPFIYLTEARSMTQAMSLITRGARITSWTRDNSFKQLLLHFHHGGLLCPAGAKDSMKYEVVKSIRLIKKYRSC